VKGTFASRAYRFYTRLSGPRVPKGVVVMNPYAEPSVRRSVRAFLDKFFDDNRERTLILGINPGRFGAGITGVTFTDPVALADFCGIPNHLARRRELSSVFIYDMIERFGGPEAFYAKFSPLGYTRGGLNLNYYDEPALAKATTPFIVDSLWQQIALGCRRDIAFVLGFGANRKYLEKLNAVHRFFDRIVALEHPRWILQYRRKKTDFYIDKYLDALRTACYGRHTGSLPGVHGTPAASA
jgi:hypothetical protein